MNLSKTNDMETTPPELSIIDYTPTEYAEQKEKEIDFQAEKNSRRSNISPVKPDHHIYPPEQQSSGDCKDRPNLQWKKMPIKNRIKFVSQQNTSSNTIKVEDAQNRREKVDLVANKVAKSSNNPLNHEDEMSLGNIEQSTEQSLYRQLEEDFRNFYEKLSKRRLNFLNQTFFKRRQVNLHMLLRWCYFSSSEECWKSRKWIPTKNLVEDSNVEKVKILIEFVYQSIMNAQGQFILRKSVPKSVNPTNKNQDITKQESCSVYQHSKLSSAEMDERESHNIKSTEEKKIGSPGLCYFVKPFFYNEVLYKIPEKVSSEDRISYTDTQPCGKHIIIKCYNSDPLINKRLNASLSFINFKTDLSMLKNFITEMLEYDFILIENENTEKNRTSKKRRKLEEVPYLSNSTKKTCSLREIAVLLENTVLLHENGAKDFSFSTLRSEQLNGDSIEVLTKDVVGYVIKRLYELKKMFPNPLEQNEELAKKIFKELISLACHFPPFLFNGQKGDTRLIFLSAYRYLLNQFSIFNPGLFEGPDLAGKAKYE